MKFNRIKIDEYNCDIQGGSSPTQKPIGSLFPIGAPLPGSTKLPPNIGRLLDFLNF